MTTMIKRSDGHYEVRKTSYGEAYLWCPECVEVECDCGERTILSASETYLISEETYWLELSGLD